MKKPLLITFVLLLIALALIAVILRSKGFLYPSADIKSVSPDTQHTARLFQLKRLIDKNYRITVRDTKTNQLIAEHFTPDEAPPNPSVRFIWTPAATAVLLVADEFYFDKDLEPRDCVPSAYLLFDLSTAPATIYTAASQNGTLPKLTNELLQSHNFCSAP